MPPPAFPFSPIINPATNSPILLYRHHRPLLLPLLLYRHHNPLLPRCSLESCGFVGTYAELRKHARAEHPTACPSEADPERRRDWLRIVQEQDLQDSVSVFRLCPESSEEEDGGGWMCTIDTFPDGSPEARGHAVSEEHGSVDHDALQEAPPATQGRQDEEGDAHADSNDKGI